MGFFWTIVVLLVLLALAWRYLGAYMVAVFEGRLHFLGFIERPIYALLGTSPEKEQTWRRYAGSVVVFSGLSIGLTYLILRVQGSLPLNPQHFGAVGPALSWNTATSFVTNTNWQNYGGEETMSYLSQMMRADRPAVRHAGRGHCGGAGHRPRLLEEGVPDRRQLLGRRHPRPALRAHSHCHHRRPDLRRPGRRRHLGWSGQHPQLAQRGLADASPSGRSASWRPSSSWGPTGAGSSTSTRPIRSRTRPA